MPLESFGRRPGEADIGGVDALSPRIRRREPEDCVGAGESRVDDGRVAVGALDDLDGLARAGRDAARVAADDAQRLAAVEQVFEDLVADQAAGCGDDDHRSSSACSITCIAMIHIRLDYRYRRLLASGP